MKSNKRAGFLCMQKTVCDESCSIFARNRPDVLDFSVDMFILVLILRESHPLIVMQAIRLLAVLGIVLLKFSDYGSHSTQQRTDNFGNPTIIVNQPVPKSNGMGTAGFVLALLALFLGWVPVVGWILWVLGLIFSCVGVFRTPKGLAIAGLIISLLGVILLLFVFAGLFAAAAVSAI
ncbi:MAG: hypothetical protein ACLR1G_01335 [Alistipes indistinctus]